MTKQNLLCALLVASTSVSFVDAGRIRGGNWFRQGERFLSNIDEEEEEVIAEESITVVNAPSSTPSVSPSVSSAPSVSPSVSSAPSPWRSDVEKLLVDDCYALWHGSEFDDDTTYQSQALTYLEGLDTTTYSDARIVQLYALLCIYYATNQVSNPVTQQISTYFTLGWLLSPQWLDNEQECNWYGITCNGSGEVISLVLSKNWLSGSFPAEVLLLAPTLQVLDITGNFLYNVQDPELYWLGNMTNLEVLFIGQNTFVYDGVPPQIAKLTNLIELDISSCVFFGDLDPQIFAPLTKLEFLDIGSNSYHSELPLTLKALPDLEYLYMDYSDFTGSLDTFLDGIGFPSLSEVWMDFNDFDTTIPTTIGNLTTLKSLGLSESSMSGTIPTELGALTEMVQIWLYGNELSGPIPIELGDLDRLERLELQSNLLTGTMPSEICDNTGPPLQTLEVLMVDCDEVTCTCCGNGNSGNGYGYGNGGNSGCNR